MRRAEGVGRPEWPDDRRWRQGPRQRHPDRQQPTLRELMDSAYRRQRAGRQRSAKAAARRGETF